MAWHCFRIESDSGADQYSFRIEREAWKDRIVFDTEAPSGLMTPEMARELAWLLLERAAEVDGKPEHFCSRCDGLGCSDCQHTGLRTCDSELEEEAALEMQHLMLLRTVKDLTDAVDGAPEALDFQAAQTPCKCGVLNDGDLCEHCEMVRLSARLKSAYNNAAEVLDLYAKD